MRSSAEARSVVGVQVCDAPGLAEDNSFAGWSMEVARSVAVVPGFREELQQVLISNH